MLPHLAGLLALVSVLTGCLSTSIVSTAPVDSLTREEAAGLDRVDAFVWMTQNRVQPATPSKPDPTPSVLTDTLNEFAYTFNSLWLKDRAAAIDAALGTFDFGSELLAVAKAKLEKVDRVAITVRPVVVRDRMAGVAQLDASNASGVLNFAVIYRLGDRGDLYFTAWATLIPKTEALKKFRPKPNENPVSFGNAIYVKEFRFVVPAPAAAPAVKAAFVEAANNLISQLVADLNSSK